MMVMMMMLTKKFYINVAMKGVIKGSVKDNLKDTSYVMVSVGATQTKDMISGL